MLTRFESFDSQYFSWMPRVIAFKLPAKRVAKAPVLIVLHLGDTPSIFSTWMLIFVPEGGSVVKSKRLFCFFCYQ